MNTEPKSQTEALSKFSELLTHVHNHDQLNNVCKILRQKLQTMSTEQIDSLVIMTICNSILSKVLITIKDDSLPVPIAELVEVIMERDLMPPVFKVIYQQKYFEHLDKNYQIERVSNNKNTQVKELKNFEDSFSFNLDVLLKLSTESEKLLHKTFGFSFIDLQGNFIWCDSNSERLFEFKNNECFEKNLFNIMIPYSVNLLNKKFGEELLSLNRKIGSSCAFSYVIYSRKAMNKYLKQLRKKGIRTLNDAPHTAKNESKSIYFRYMKALSSRATLVVLKYTDKELEELKEFPNMEVNLTEDLKSREADVDVFSDEENKGEVNGDGKTAEGGFKKVDDVHYKLAIMLETRIARTIPDFDYVKMLEDPQIIEFETIIAKKIVNKYSRV